MKQLLIIISALLLFSCSNDENKQKAENMRKYEERCKEFDKQSIEINKEIVARQQDTIKQYIKNNHLEMQQSERGLWYSIKPSGDTNRIKQGDIVSIAYEISLLNGKVCYTSDSTGYKEFKVGEGGVESGLEDAILLMHKGDYADLLIPPYLAHGLIGDQNKIPYLAILHYKVVVKEHFFAKE